ncbi:MAG: NUDIX domain-containing protein [Firmicutes bacterium]|nr:NUDIX domain-containing protein [Bacillota bacterium]
MIAPETLGAIGAYVPRSAQEASDQRLILLYARQHPETVLTRENEIAHITSSGFIVNAACDRALMAHHTLRGAWAWTGGHADGENDLLAVAVREAYEETGVHALPQTGEIAAVDILYMPRHVRRGRFVSTHLHLNVSYILVANENERFTVKPGENTAIRWFHASEITAPLFHADDAALYGRLWERAAAGL